MKRSLEDAAPTSPTQKVSFRTSTDRYDEECGVPSNRNAGFTLRFRRPSRTLRTDAAPTLHTWPDTSARVPHRGRPCSSEGRPSRSLSPRGLSPRARLAGNYGLPTRQSGTRNPARPFPKSLCCHGSLQSSISLRTDIHHSRAEHNQVESAGRNEKSRRSESGGVEGRTIDPVRT